MGTWSIVLCVVFGILIAVFIFLNIRSSNKNQTRQNLGVLIPFAGYLSPPNGQYWSVTPNPKNVGTSDQPENGLFLSGFANGESTPQITCPIGTKVNIVGAFLEVNDPFGECSGQPTNTFSLSCGNPSSTSSAQLCSTTSDCPVGMYCNSGKCIPSTCSIDSDCANGTMPACPAGMGDQCSTEGARDPSIPSLVCMNGVKTFDPAYGQCMHCNNGTCQNIPLCTNLQSVSGIMQNKTCSGGNCKIRDASSYLAGHCDGKQTCLGDASDMWMPNVPGGVFGPLPCNIPASSTNLNYSTLPVIPGWNQSTPVPGTENTLNASNFSQGYYVHGIYTCVPDEDLQTSN